jgi:hypothetical protein
MSSNVGLTTPRGSGTSGYVQRNLSALKPRQHHTAGQPYPPRSSEPLHRQRQPDQAILKHEREREVEVQVLELRDKLEDEGLEEEEIDEKCEALRKELLDEIEGGGGKGGKDVGGKAGKGKLKSYQVHEMAEEKLKEQERLRRAVGIGKDYVEGSYWERRDREAQRKMGGGEAESDKDGETRRGEKEGERERGS